MSDVFIIESLQCSTYFECSLRYLIFIEAFFLILHLLIESTLLHIFHNQVDVLDVIEKPV
jgi:hypothetical protein